MHLWAVVANPVPAVGDRVQASATRTSLGRREIARLSRRKCCTLLHMLHRVFSADAPPKPLPRLAQAGSCSPPQLVVRPPAIGARARTVAATARQLLSPPMMRQIQPV
jgi:hypothetical protein